jgi:uncharacterized protein YjeT (DUF2065 family)
MAFALLLVVEGALPFAAPRLWRDAFRKLTEMSDGQIRFVGLVSLGCGALMMVLFGRA